jgi:aminoglycoside phosphotransferase (APT) family kinase protein
MMVNHGAVTAMLDWELWHVGDSTEDLAYARSDVVQALPWDDFLAEYYRHGGNEYSPAALLTGSCGPVFAMQC